MSLKRLGLAAMLALGATIGTAEAAPLLNGAFTIDVYQGDGGGNANDLRVQALDTNPLITGEPLATVTYVGLLDFSGRAGSANTIGEFFQSGTSTSITGLDATTAALTMSTGPFATTTVLDINFTSVSIPDGSISHDDGIGLYVNGSLVTSPAAAAPTVEVATGFASPTGNYRLIYVAANGPPQVLIGSGTPTPVADFVDFGCRIDLAQAGVAPAFQFTLPASSSAKFCPATNGGTLKLTCSGTIPGYAPGPAISAAAGVVCRISGSQCGINRVLPASVRSIEIGSDGLATLTCETTVAG